MTVTVVLGMHRSGTSALAKLLNNLGLASGDRLLPANEHNADGHFEDIDVLAIDEAMLKRLGTVWHLPLNPGRLNQSLDRGDLAEELSQAAALVRDRVARYPNWFVKEPRLSLLMPFWQRVFAQEGINARYVWMVRHPAQVDASLRARDQLGSIHNAQTWLSYQLSILAAVQGQPTYLLDYETLLGDQSDWLASFGRFLGLKLTQDQMKDILESSVSRHLQRQRTLTFNENSLVDQLYSELKQAEPVALTTEVLADLSGRWLLKSAELAAPWDWASELDLKNRELLMQVRDAGEVAQINAAEAQANLGQLQTTLEQLRVQRLEVERLAGELVAKQDTLEQAYSEISELQANRAELQDQVMAQGSRIQQLELDLEGLNAQFLTTRELLKHAEQGIADREDQLALVLNSTSWKLTKPLRWVKKLIAGR